MNGVVDFISANFLWIVLGIILVFIIIGICIANFSYDNFLKKLEKYDQMPCSFWGSAFEFARYVSEGKFAGRIKVKAESDAWSEGSYSPQDITVTLKTSIANTRSLAGVAIVAHEFGHTLQHMQNPNILIKNNKYHKFVKILGNINWVLVISGIALGILVNYIFFLVGLGLIILNTLIAIGLKVSTVNLERDASKNAIMILEESEIFQKEEIVAVKKFLKSALQTYKADFFSALLSWTGLVKRTNFF